MGETRLLAWSNNYEILIIYDWELDWKGYSRSVRWEGSLAQTIMVAMLLPAFSTQHSCYWANDSFLWLSCLINKHTLILEFCSQSIQLIPELLQKSNCAQPQCQLLDFCWMLAMATVPVWQDWWHWGPVFLHLLLRCVPSTCDYHTGIGFNPYTLCLALIATLIDHSFSGGGGDGPFGFLFCVGCYF